MPLISKSEGGNGCLDATTDLDQIRAWWAKHPRANVGVATGGESGIWVLDVDSGGGAKTLEALTETHGALPDTPRADTPGGGQHFIFRNPADGRLIKNDTGRKVGHKIDVRGEGGYIVVAPSIHPNGEQYTWDEDSHPLKIEVADAPDWLLDLIAVDPGFTGRKRSANHWAGLAKPQPAGSRNESVTSVAGKLLRDLDVDLAIYLIRLYAAACNPPLEAEEVSKIIKSICRRETDRVEKKSQNG